MKKILLSLAAIAISLGASAQYTNGYFIVNEGQYGNGSGPLNFYSAKTGEMQYDVYATANEGATFGMTPQFATVADGKLFVCSKQNFGNGGRLVVADAKTLATLTSQAEIDGSADTRGIAVVPGADKFFVGTNMGVYAYDLTSFEKIGLVEGSSDPEAGTYSPGSGDMVVLNGMVYVASPDKIMVIDPATNAVSKTIEVPSLVSVFEMDGALYGACNSCTWGTPSATDTEQFVKISEVGEVEKTYTVPMASTNFWFTPKPCQPVVIPGTHTIVYSPGEGTNYLCKYDFDTETFTEKFITFDGRQQMYGHCVEVDPSTSQILVATFQSYSSTNYWFNIYSADGEVVSSTKLNSRYWFPTKVLNAEKDDATAVENLNTESAVTSVTYINMAGHSATTPFEGVNIVVTRHANGQVTTSKVML